MQQQIISNREKTKNSKEKMTRVKQMAAKLQSQA